MFELTPPENRGERIRKIFAEHGAGMSLHRFGEYLVDHSDLYTPEHHRSAIVEKAKNDAHHALKVKDAKGLPFAGPTSRKDVDGAPEWAMRQLWLKLDYDSTFTEYEDAEDESHDLKLKIADECFERFGAWPDRTHPRRRRNNHDDNDPQAA